MSDWNVVDEKFQREDFVQRSISITKEFDDLLNKLSKEKGLPYSVLIWIALDNEVDSVEPFSYDCPQPKTTFVEHSYTNETRKIFAFLKRHPLGITIQVLTLMRRMIGIPDRLTLSLALRELLHTKLAYLSNNKPRGQVYRPYSDDHIWIRLSKESLEHIERERKLLEKKKAQLEEDQQNLERREHATKPPTKEWE